MVYLFESVNFLGFLNFFFYENCFYLMWGQRVVYFKREINYI